MSEIKYRLIDPHLAHASYTVGHYDRSKYNPTKYSDKYKKTEAIIGRKNTASRVSGYKYGHYASPYYDPVARHERYLRERSSLGIGKGLDSIGGGSSGGRGGGKGKSGKGGKGKAKKGSKGRGGKGSMKANLAGLSEEIAKLKEESSLDTEAQREAARRKIEDLKEELRQQMEKLSGVDEESELNVSEIRGRIQSIRKEIEDAGGDLQSWVTREKAALERRIAALYNARGLSYNTNADKDKENAAKARDKEVKSRADSIYKSKSKK